MEDYKKLLTDLYTVNDPERIKQIDYFLERYKGKERQFYVSQQAKYKKQKPVSDSKKIIEEALARIKAQSDDKSKAKIDSKPKITKKVVTESKEVNVPIKTADEKKTVVSPVVTEKEIVKESAEENKKKEDISDEKKPIINEKKKDPSPQEKPAKKDIWFDEKSKQTSSAQIEKPPFETDKNFKKKYFLYIFGSVLLVIILAVVVFFVFFYAPTTKKVNTTTEKPKTTITKKTTVTKPEETTSSTEESSIKSKKAIQQTLKPKVKTTTKKQAPSYLGGVYIKKGSITLPAYFVACSAVRKESLAVKKVRELKAKGFAASYYWIPDFVDHGSPYFKVVIGPFATRMDAMKKLTPVQERAEFDAYVLELK